MFFDVDDSDCGFQISDTMGMDSDGNMMMRVGDSMAMVWTRASFILCQAGMMTTMIVTVLAAIGMTMIVTDLAALGMMIIATALAALGMTMMIGK